MEDAPKPRKAKSFKKRAEAFAKQSMPPSESAGAAHAPAREPRSPAAKPQPKPRDGSELAAATRAEAFKAIFAHAARLVSIKDWSRSGLSKRLAERFKKAPDAVQLASEAAGKMLAIGAIDDIRFARGFIRARLGKRSLPAALRELAGEGVSKEDAEAAMEELREEGLIAEPADQAWAVWSRKFSSAPADEREKGKQARFMASRGFSFEAINKVWARAKAGAAD